MEITEQQVIATLREVVAERPEYVYEAPEYMVRGAGQCLYVHRDADGSNPSPGCLVGHVLHRLGVPIEKLEQREGENAKEVCIDLGIPAGQMLLAAQYAQDGRRSWGEALAKALR